MRRTWMGHALGLGVSLALAAPAAWAQPAEEEEPPAEEEKADEAPKGDEDRDKAADKGGADEDKGAEEGDGAADDGDAYDPSEDPDEAYTFIGMRFRNLIVPEFMIRIFADGGATVNAFTFGPEFVYRRDHLEFDLALSYADYSMDPFMFKGKDDDDRAFERVWSDMKILYFTVDVMYEWPIDDGRFGFALGGGVGLGVVFDHLYRHQVYPLGDPNNVNPDDPGSWGDCRGVGDPPVVWSDGQLFCDDDNSHYPDPATGEPYNEPSWANGGSKPFVFPWISLPALSFRFKPVKTLQTRLDAGFSITGFYVGLAAHYGL